MSDTELTPENAAEFFRVAREPDYQPPEPPVEGRAPREKLISECTAEEHAAERLYFEQVLRRQAREKREAEQRELDKLNRPDSQRFGDAISDSLDPANRRVANEAFIRSLHPER